MGVDDSASKVRLPVRSRTRLKPWEGEALKQNLSRAEELARVDFLTGLDSRREFLEKAKKEFGDLLRGPDRRQGTLGLVLIDLDNYKQVNDKLGHLKGDEVLQQVAQVLRSEFRAGDTIGRWGGDELVVLLPIADEEELKTILYDRRHENIDKGGRVLPGIITEVRNKIPVLNGVEWSLSAGYAVFDEECLQLPFDEAMQAVFNRADQGMYRDKDRRGRKGTN